jgi:hypothetical protein
MRAAEVISYFMFWVGGRQYLTREIMWGGINCVVSKKCCMHFHIRFLSLIMRPLIYATYLCYLSMVVGDHYSTHQGNYFVRYLGGSRSDPKV